MSTPAIAVAVAAHDRPLRLRWLLNALQEQTLDAARFEVVVVHDSRGEGPETVLRTHPLAAAGTLRHERLPAGRGSIPVQRNRAWRATRAPIVAFTDDDCRPAPDWLERLLEAAAPDAVVQGTTRPDAAELGLLQRAPHVRTMTVDPPGPWGQACNIAYPRAVLERVAGFDEALALVGEDTDLLQRALATGARLVAAPDALVEHAVHEGTLLGDARGRARWADVALVVRRHPQLRAGMPVRLFWKRRHATLVLAGVGAFTRRPAVAAALALPWVADALPAYGSGVRGRLRAAAELPGRALLDAAEIAAVTRGGAHHRTVLL